MNLEVREYLASHSKGVGNDFLGLGSAYLLRLISSFALQECRDTVNTCLSAVECF
jgi:hypothetical protein